MPLCSFHYIPLDWTNLKAIFELSSRRKSLLYFFPGALNIKLVNSFILVWHSDYELSSKTQKPFFILKESSKCHNINYRAKNHVVMFCFGLQSIARLINTNASYFNTHGLRVEENFPETFNLSGKNIKMLFTGLGRSVLGESVPCVWVQSPAYGLGRYSRPGAQFLPIRTSQPVNNICISWNIFKKYSKHFFFFLTP